MTTGWYFSTPTTHSSVKIDPNIISVDFIHKDRIKCYFINRPPYDKPQMTKTRHLTVDPGWDFIPISRHKARLILLSWQPIRRGLRIYSNNYSYVYIKGKL